MKFSTILAQFALLPALALAVTVSFDQAYDNAGQSLNTVSCSNGPNGLVGQFPTFGALPSFPNIGGAAAVAGFGSPNCGTCWALKFTNTKGVSKTINVIAIDHTDDGFNISLEAMNTLTGGQAEFLGRVDATATQVAASVCGL